MRIPLRFNAMRAWSVIAMLMVIGACYGKSPTSPGFPSGSVRVLFIGNSLTYSNDLPGMFIALARLAGDNQVQAASIAFPNYSLEDHWAEGSARRSLKDRSWEFVVMQQGSSALPASQINLRTWSLQFEPLIRDAGAVPVLFMVWPLASREFDFPNVLYSYREAASTVNGIFAPAGDGWTAFGNLQAMYSSDGLHPTVFGTYISAVVLLERVRGIRPEQLPANIPGSSADAATVRALQQAARVALDRNVARPIGSQPQP